MPISCAGWVQRLDRLVTDEEVEPDRIAIISTRTLKRSPFAGEHRAGRFELVNLDYTANRRVAVPRYVASYSTRCIDTRAWNATS